MGINFKAIFLFLLCTSLFVISGCCDTNRISVATLECNGQESPVAIDDPTPVFSWKISSIERGFIQKGYEIIVADNIEDAEKCVGNMWSCKNNGSDNSIMVYYDGKPFKSSSNYFWRVRVKSVSGECSPWSKVSGFSTGILETKEWNNAEWIAMEPTKKESVIVPGVHGSHDDMLGDKKTPQYKIPIFRKDFKVKRPVAAALAYVTGLGHFDMFLNGEKVGDNFLDPAWTLYDKHCYYLSFDITSGLKDGDNCVGIMVGNGFYNVPHERYHKLITSFGSPRVLVNMVITYEDGSREIVVSDESWGVSESPITYSSIYGGEDYDARKLQKGWLLNGFDDSSWQKAIKVDQKSSLISQNISPMKIMEPVPVNKITKNKKGNYIYDLGQNFSGIPSIKVKGERGTSLKLWTAELLNDDMTVYQWATGSPIYYQYTLSGDGDEYWQPQFTYSGQRYIEVEGAVPEGEPNPGNLPVVAQITGLHTRNSAETKGSFRCSKPLFNKTFSLIDWAIRSNFAHVMTDCPHREKLGWLEQTYLMGPSIKYNYDVSQLYAKGIDDMSASQRDNGLVADIAPEYVVFEGGFVDSPEWGSASVMLPWYQYKWYGDKRLMEKGYDMMCKYVDYLGSQSDGYLLNHGLGDWLDLGPNHPGYAQLTSVGLTATATYYQDVKIMVEVAEILGKNEDVVKYNDLAKNIKYAFNKHYFNDSDKTYDTNSQTASAMPLTVGLVEPENHKFIVNNLVKDIQSRGNSVTAGDVGYTYVIKTLLRENLHNVVYDMNSRFDVPGYGYNIVQGATSLTESWQAARSISHNHFCLGQIMEWFYEGIGGISQADNDIAYKNIIISPSVVGDLTYADVSYDSPYGVIESRWTFNNGKFTLKIRVPENTTATVKIHNPLSYNVYESGVLVNDRKDVKLVGFENHKTVVEVGSGYYEFIVDNQSLKRN